MTNATKTIRSVYATITAYEGEEPCDWIGYVAVRLTELYPGAYVDISYGNRNEAWFADGEPLPDFGDIVAGWWDDLCSQPDHPAWGDDEDVDVQIEVTSVTPREGDYEAQVSITVGDEIYEGTVILREDTSRPRCGRRLGTCGAPLDAWASDQVVDALAAAKQAGLDRAEIVGEIEAHVTEAAAGLLDAVVCPRCGRSDLFEESGRIVAHSLPDGSGTCQRQADESDDMPHL